MDYRRQVNKATRFDSDNLSAIKLSAPQSIKINMSTSVTSEKDAWRQATTAAWIEDDLYR